MNHLTLFLLSLALATTATVVRAETAAEPAAAATGVVEGVAADASPEMQAERDELVRQWEADARAAGIDPATAEADTGQDQSSK